MRTRTLALCALAALSLSGCGKATPTVSQGGSDLKGTVAVSGAFALYPMMTVWADEFSKVHPKVKFDIQAGGAGKGMTDALAGAVDIGMVSREIKAEEEAKGAYWVSVAKDAVFPVINAKNPVLQHILSNGIDQATLSKIFITGEIKTWGEAIGKPEINDAIHVYTRSDSAGSADTWAQFCGGKAQADILAGAIGVFGEPALVDTIQKDSLGIGYSNLNSVYDPKGAAVAGILVPPIDANGNGMADPEESNNTRAETVKAVADGRYPSPPARFENLVTKGKARGVTRDFIEWILGDGQRFLGQAGYVALTSDQRAASLAKIK
ncbi:MAG: substrate-binding domain-containing protein [Rectinemataceae bacterium]